jgi:ferritin-like metal-binding protein YciE
MADVNDIRGLMIDCVQDLYANETQTMKLLPAIMDGATAPELKTALREHREQSQKQAQRLERIAGTLGEGASGPKRIWARGILEDAQRDIKSVTPGLLLDAALAGAVRKLEQSEVASYETALGVARAMGLIEATQLLEQTHAEEQAMDARLRTILETTLGGLSAAL